MSPTRSTFTHRIGRPLLAAAFSMVPVATFADAPRVERVEAIAATPIPIGESTVSEFSGTMGIGEANGTSHWQVLYWHGDEVELVPFKGFREIQAAFDWNQPEADDRLAEPNVSGSPLMIFRVHHGDAGYGKPGMAFRAARVKGTAIGETVRERWNRTFAAAGQSWTLRADYVKGSDGRILPGSMQLTLEGKGRAAPAVVLDRAPGMIFRDQTVLWAGDLTRDGFPDFLIRRTLITGEVDYVLSLSNPDGRYAAGGVTIDPDHSVNGFSSGIEESEHEAWLRANSPRPYPVYKVPQAAPTPRYAKSGPMAVSGISLYANPQAVQVSLPGVPVNDPGQTLAPTAGVKRDISFTFDGETHRIVVELVPTYAGEYRDPAYASQLFFGAYGGTGGLSLTVALYHNGVRQVLLVTQPYMDDGDMRLTAGDLDGSGELSLSIDWWPHYNNAMNHVWKRVHELGRVVKRVSSFQSQGC